MTTTTCSVCTDVARLRGIDENNNTRDFCNFHASRARADRVIMATSPINTHVKDKKPLTVKRPAPPGMF